MVKSLNKYLSLVKFSHTIFAMPFAMIGFFYGIQQVGSFSWWLLPAVLVCMVAARNAAMGFNRYLDRDIDALNPRTATREIPSGILKPSSVLIFVIINVLIFIGVSFCINILCGVLAPFALVVLLGYSYMKRVSSLCHIVLGLALGIAPSAAFIAVTGTLTLPIILLSIIVVLWVSGFDILYSLADEEFDKENKLNSIPVLLGRTKAMVLSGILHLAILPILCYLAFYFYNIFFFIGASFFALMLIYQHLIVSPKDLSRLNAAFFTTNGIASLIFGILVVLGLIF